MRSCVHADEFGIQWQEKAETHRGDNSSSSSTEHTQHRGFPQGSILTDNSQISPSNRQWMIAINTKHMYMYLPLAGLLIH